MNKILVIGGAGFIGSNLCEHLFLNGYDIVCLDNFSTGCMYNIQHLLNEYPFFPLSNLLRNIKNCLPIQQYRTK